VRAFRLSIPQGTKGYKTLNDYVGCQIIEGHITSNAACQEDDWILEEEKVLRSLACTSPPPPLACLARSKDCQTCDTPNPVPLDLLYLPR